MSKDLSLRTHSNAYTFNYSALYSSTLEIKLFKKYKVEILTVTL